MRTLIQAMAFFCLALASVLSHAAEYPRNLPELWTPEQTPVVVATQIWRNGLAYLAQTGEDVLAPTAISKETLTELNETELEVILEKPASRRPGSTRSFLDKAYLYPVIQFSCAISIQRYESHLMAALDDTDNGKKLIALAVLLKKRAPRSVPQQWRALNELRTVYKDGTGKVLLDDMAGAFEPEALAATIHNYDGIATGDLHDLHWAIRAAGPVQAATLIPQLTKLSVSEELYTSLAAEASLAELQGPEADAALATCAAAWRYNASNHASRELLKRGRKDLLCKTLLAHPAPEKSKYDEGILLGMCGAPEAVPILCATVHEIGIVDGQMFRLINELATREHLPAIREMVKRVRPEQLEQAKKTLHDVEERCPLVQ